MAVGAAAQHNQAVNDLAGVAQNPLHPESGVAFEAGDEVRADPNDLGKEAEVVEAPVKHVFGIIKMVHPQFV